ncbi:unnamed protein product [Closterium sp. NIES-65]|nr:unnamed protein product [Closterium sp. NIES-65]
MSGIDCSALLPQGRKLVVKELLPVCSAFYYVQPADTCASVAQFLSITEESLQQLNPSVSCSSRLPAFHSLCVERTPAKARPTCANKIRIGRVVDFKQVAASNGATMVDLCRLNPWISFRDSPRDIHIGINCSALLPQGRDLVVKELLPACSAFYYVQPFLSITEESLQQLNPGVSCSSRLLAFRSLCEERNPAKARPKCESQIQIDRVMDFKQVAASNGATMVDLCRLNPWICFRDSLRDINIVCFSHIHSFSDVRGVLQ